MTSSIHHGQPVRRIGAEPPDARLVVILLHGRGADAESMIPLAEELGLDGVRFLIPQAGLNRWYPQTAFGPLEANEPDLSSALEKIDHLVQEAHQQGFTSHQIVFGGFSQGACLAAEYTARNPQKYGGLFIFSGALIGPPGKPRSDLGSLDGMPVFISGSDVDPWVAHDLLSMTAGVFESMGAEVEFRTYPGMAHTVNLEEVDYVREMLARSMQSNSNQPSQ